ncbi:MAG: hypothetical protein ACTHZW_07085, partial [Microbacteriaceae bacterium]
TALVFLTVRMVRTGLTVRTLLTILVIRMFLIFLVTRITPIILVTRITRITRVIRITPIILVTRITRTIPMIRLSTTRTRTVASPAGPARGETARGCLVAPADPVAVGRFLVRSAAVVLVRSRSERERNWAVPPASAVPLAWAA